MEWGQSSGLLKLMQFVEPVEQLEFFEAWDQYSQEPPLTEIKNLENPQLFIECYFVQNNQIF
jgi:hypothetical protein